MTNCQKQKLTDEFLEIHENCDRVRTYVFWLRRWTTEEIAYGLLRPIAWVIHVLKKFGITARQIQSSE